jgi:hypothetical protein
MQVKWLEDDPLDDHLLNCHLAGEKGMQRSLIGQVDGDV